MSLVPSCPHARLHRLVVVTAAAFGLLSLVAGGRVLLGLGAPDHVVVRPILVYNTLMGVVYVLGAMLLARDLSRGRIAAAVVAGANFVALLGLVLFRASGGAAANDTMGAMVLRVVVWAGIWFAASWMLRRPVAAA